MKAKFRKEYEVFRRCLVEGRKVAGLTQSQVAEALRKPQSYVAKYESGERRLDVIEFLIIANCLNLNSLKVIKEIQSASDVL